MSHFAHLNVKVIVHVSEPINLFIDYIHGYIYVYMCVRTCICVNIIIS